MKENAMSESAIFKAAVKLAPERRAAYLDQSCGADPELRREVESLLRAHDASGSFLQDPPARPQATVDDPPILEGPGTVIGPYKLLQQIGEGGMGVVYMAEQQEPIRRKVALKIIKPGMDSRQVLARFEAERQALALMDHQNIAKVLDAGTTSEVRDQKSEVRKAEERPGALTSDLCPLTSGHGRPYFVMELVHGIALTKYCDDNQLTLRQRLELFVPICQAIQHAHQKGIIHRDVKPSNVLVTMYDDKPVPKVIDFGVAKAVEQRLTEKTLFTQFGTLVGTFEYMSPEQAEMNAFGVDTRSDIYSLGVLLYELLTGTTPLQRQRLREAAWGEIVRLIQEEEPPKPSTRLSSSGAALATISRQRGSAPEKLTQLVRGELDWIVMRCLEKDRTRRYETANALARDVERYLKDEPVEACPPTAGYKLRKFARKHKNLLVTAAAFAALLLLGVAGSTWQAVRAMQAEGVALANEDLAKASAARAEIKEQEAKKERDEVKALNEKLQKALKQLQETQEKLQHTLYAARINLAQHSWEAGGPKRVRDLLEQHRPQAGETDLRYFEWYYLYRLSHAELLTLQGHTDRVNSVAYSPDGKRLASASADKTVKVWEAQTGKEIFTFKGHAGLIQSVVFSPDGKSLASVSLDRTLKVWDAQTGKELLSVPHLGWGALNVVFSPDGNSLACHGKVWDAQTGTPLLGLRVAFPIAVCVAFSPDGKRLATVSGDDTLTVWDVQTRQELITVKGHAKPGGVAAVGRYVAFSPDGKRLASAFSPNLVKVWDAQTGQELLTLKGHTDRVYDVAFSPDGKRLASAGDKTLRLWDAQTGQELLTFKGHDAHVSGVAFSPDGKYLASAGDRTVKVWDTQTGQKPPTLNGQAGPVASVAFSPDGKRLASGSAGYDAQKGEFYGVVKAWHVQTGQELFTFKGQDGWDICVAFSPDGKRLASAGNKTVKVWDAQTGLELLCFEGGGGSLAFSPDGNRLATSDPVVRGKPISGEVKVWDAQTGKELLTLKGHSRTTAHRWWYYGRAWLHQEMTGLEKST
jgi:WD40 repeat protein/serine/threonine protein kinase